MTFTLVQVAQREFDDAEKSFSRADDKEYEEAAAKIASRHGLLWEWSEWGGIKFKEAE